MQKVSGETWLLFPSALRWRFAGWWDVATTNRKTTESSTASSAQASEGAYEKDRVTTTYTESEKYVYPPFTGETTDASFHNEHAVSTEQLISLVEHNAELKSLLEKSIAKAAEINPDRTTNPAQTLEEYYFFLDWAATALPWQIAPFVSEYSTLYDLFCTNNRFIKLVKASTISISSLISPSRSWRGVGTTTTRYSTTSRSARG